MTNRNFAKFIVFFFLILSISIYFYKYKYNVRNKLPDISKINLKLSVIRLDKAFFELKNKNKDSISSILGNNKLFVDEFLNEKQINKNSGVVNRIHKMINDPEANRIYTETKKIFNNIDDIQNNLNIAIKYIKYHFPNFHPPKLYIFNTSMSMDLFVNDKLIVMDPSFFMGPTANYKPEIPNYLLNQYKPNTIIPKIILLISRQFNKFDIYDQTLLADMIYYGKAYFFTLNMLPSINEELILGYSKKELKYLKDNLLMIWEYFIENKILYSKSGEQKRKYINEAPFIAILGRKFPGKIGRWIGLQIIKNYFKKNKEINISSLMSDTDVQNIFIQSSFNPK